MNVWLNYRKVAMSSRTCYSNGVTAFSSVDRAPSPVGEVPSANLGRRS